MDDTLRNRRGHAARYARYSRKPPYDKAAGLFGDWLRGRRIELEGTMESLAAQGHLGLGRINELENGRRNLFGVSVNTLFKLCVTYKLQPEAVVRRMFDMWEKKRRGG